MSSETQSSPSNRQSDPDFYIRHLRGWLRACDNEHDADCHATPISERHPHAIPDWVIDTEKACIVPGSSVQKYAALSYTWDSKAGGMMVSP